MVAAVAGEAKRLRLVHLKMGLVVVEEEEESAEVARMKKIVLIPYRFSTLPKMLYCPPLTHLSSFYLLTLPS